MVDMLKSHDQLNISEYPYYHTLLRMELITADCCISTLELVTKNKSCNIIVFSVLLIKQMQPWWAFSSNLLTLVHIWFCFMSVSLHKKARPFLRCLSWGLVRYLEGFCALHRREVVWNMPSGSGVQFYCIILQCRQIEPRLDVTPQSTGARFSAASSSPGLADQNVGTGAPSLPGVSYGLDTLC